MKFNTTYTPKISLRKTIQETDRVVSWIVEHYTVNYKAYNVLVPPFLDENDDMLLNLDEITRVSTFDFAGNTKTGRALLTPSNWMRDVVFRMNAREKEGVWARTDHIWRDLPETPFSTPSRYNLTFQIKLPDDYNLAVEETRKHAAIFYSLLAKQSAIFDRRYDNNTDFPEVPSFVTAQQMENEYPDMKSREKEIEFANELNAFIFSKCGKKLYSGHIHTWIPPQIYDLENFYQIVTRDSVNNEILKVASIGLLASGEILEDQLMEHNLDTLKTNNFYEKFMKKSYNIVEIKINIGRLMMALLQKGHISEVVPGVVSESSELIKEKYKIEKY